MHLGEHLDADDRLSVRDGELYLEECSLTELARRFGTPLNVVSQERLQRRAREFAREFGEAWSEGPVQVLPSLKANFSLALRRLLTLEGLGCDTFGSSELQAALACGVPPGLISVNGSSKSPRLMRDVILAGASLTLDSLREARLAVAIAADLKTIATIRLRLRPDYSSLTALSEFAAEPHAIAEVTARYKPGLPREELAEAARLLRASDWVTVVGCHAHVGRHRPDLAMWEAVIPCYVREIAALTVAMGGEWRPQVIDVGGGFSPRRDPVGLSHAPADVGDAGGNAGSEPRRVPSVAEYARVITETLRRELERAGLPASGVTLQLEPGRSLYANAGLHLATVVNLKEERQEAGGVARTQRWVEADTSEAFLPDVNLEGVRWTVVPVARPDADAFTTADIVGISCGFDVLVQDALLPALAPGDLLAFLDTGAYQDSGSNNFNAMPRPATVLVAGDGAEVVKRAETTADVFRRDVVPARFGPVSGLGSGSGSSLGSPGDRFDHSGLVVADLERSLGFYRDRIGLELLDQGAETDARYAEMLGVPRVRFVWAELDLGGGHVLELLRFDEPSGGASQAISPATAAATTTSAAPGVATGAVTNGASEAASGAAREATPPPTVVPGVAHLGIRVDDIDAAYETLVSDGASVFSRPIELGEDNRWLGLRVYEHHGFRLVTPVEKERLLRRYWQIPERQVETSVVLRLPEAVPGERGTP